MLFFFSFFFVPIVVDAIKKFCYRRRFFDCFFLKEDITQACVDILISWLLRMFKEMN